LPSAALFHAVENYSSRIGGIFHSVELLPPIFPQCGKNGPKLFHCVEKWTQSCSIVWKNRVPGRGFFHSVELLSPIFPQCGTFAVDFSTAWKIPLMRDKYISTVWNFCCGFFHGVENPADAG
jgi:hypothetical protein